MPLASSFAFFLFRTSKEGIHSSFSDFYILSYSNTFFNLENALHPQSAFTIKVLDKKTLLPTEIYIR